MSVDDKSLYLIIHAPSETALARARSNAANLRAAAPEAQVEIVINGPAVAAALSQPHATDELLRVCDNTLARLAQSPPAHWVRVPAAVLHIARRQQQGWAYMRA